MFVSSLTHRLKAGAGAVLVTALSASFLPGALLATLLLAPDARADDTSRARSIFQEGVALEAAGDFAAALKKFKEVAQVKKTPQVLFHIALCQEKLGQLVEALGGYRIAAGEAAASGDPKLAEVKKTVDASIEGLEKRIPMLTVKRGKGASVASIELDGVKLGPAQIGKPMRVNPGPHRVDASSGKETFREEIDVAEGDTKSISVKLKGGDDDPSAGPAADAEDKPPPPAGAKKNESILPWVIGGIGAGSLVASGVFFLMRSSAASDLQSQCINTVCPAASKDTADKAKSMNTLGTVTLVLGVAALGTAGVLLLSSDDGKPEKPKGSVQLRVHPSTHFMGASLGGAFLSKAGRLGCAHCLRSSLRAARLSVRRRRLCASQISRGRRRDERRNRRLGWLGG